MRQLDKAGVDLLTWTASLNAVDLAIQCKGFEVLGHEVGTSQVNQWLGSIQAFATSGLTVATYCLLVNRPFPDSAMRAQLRAALDGLVHSGQAGRALLWDVHELVTAAHDTMLERVRHVLLTDNEARAAEARQHDLFLCDPLEAVPYEVSELLIDPNRLVEESASERRHGDPGAELLDGDGARCAFSSASR